MVINENHCMLMKQAEVQKEIEDLIDNIEPVYWRDEESRDAFKKYLQDGGFYNDPASTRYHLSCKSGLARHSLNVYRELVKQVNGMKDMDISYPESEMIITGLFHDLCKMGKYVVEMRNTKQDGVWIQVPYYTYKSAEARKGTFLGHGNLSVYRLETFLKLPLNVMEAIINHMGTYGKSGEDSAQVIDSYATNKLSIATHLADMSATFLVEGGITNDMIEGLELM